MPGPMELLGLVIGAAAAFALLETIIRRTDVGAGVVLVAAAVVITFPFPPRLGVGGSVVTLWDMVSALLLTAAIARLLRAREVTGLQWLLIAFGLVALASVIQGVHVHGFSTALNESRKYFAFVSIPLYFSTVRIDRRLLDRIATAWLLLCGFLVMLALMRWLAGSFGFSGALAGALTGDAERRVVHAAPTLIMLQGFLIGALAWARGAAPTWMRRLTPVLLGFVVLMQHRSVWAVALVTIGLLVLFEREFARKLIPVTVVALLSIGALSLAVFEEGADVRTELAESAAYRGTWEWRIAGWHALLTGGPQEPTEMLIGQPFGSGFERLLNGSLVTVSPHNFYLETYLRTGLLGLGLLVAMYVLILWRLVTNRAFGGFLSDRALFLLLMTHPVFFIPYTPGPEQGLLFGLAMAAATALNAQDSQGSLYADARTVGLRGVSR